MVEHACNNGHGQFTKSQQLLPIGRPAATACVHAADYDKDGDLDLAVGGRLRPFLYGVPVNTYILSNDGKPTEKHLAVEGIYFI